MKTPYRVGLTGSIGSGKSTVAGIFAEKGVPVLDADEMARMAVRPGTEALEQIKSIFGQEVISEAGELQRNRLREIIFSDDDKRTQLEAIIHPRVYKMLEDAVSRISYPYCILSIPLLLEPGTNGFQVDEVIVVDAPETQQISRVCKRDNVTPESVRNIMRVQMDNIKKLEHADEIINNDADIGTLKSQVDKLHEKYLAISENK